MSSAGARKLEARLAKLVAMERRDVPVDDAEVRSALGSKTGILVAAAARVVTALELTAFHAELAPAFVRLLERPVERDPGCRGKVAVARALHHIDRWEDDVFTAGVRWVQLEPVWGGREDAAAELRGVCGLAFAHAGRGDALDVLADLLADSERMTRTAAAQALGDCGRVDGAALLRFKVRIGDDEPAVIAACLGSLLALAPRTALDFVLELLAGESDRAAAAAIALGESRQAAAVPRLVAWCEQVSGDLRGRVGYLALALVRDDAATTYLLGEVERAEAVDAIAAARALATFRDDPRRVAAVRAAAERRRDARVAAAIEVELAR